MLEARARRSWHFSWQYCPLGRFSLNHPEPSPSLAEHRVRVSRVADQVSDRIRDLIINGTLRDGDRLPRAEVLMKDFGASGPSVREALRILESEGLITVLRGSAGGCIVHRPDAQTAAYLVALVLSSLQTQMGDVLKATAVLEPVCAMLCAQRPDRAKTVVSELQQLNTEARELLRGDYVKFAQNMMSFHETLVQRCGNETITLLAGVLETIWFAKARRLAEDPVAHQDDQAERLELVASHEKICGLIELGEDFQVHQLTAKHIEAHRVYAHRVDPAELVNATEIRNSRQLQRNNAGKRPR